MGVAPASLLNREDTPNHGSYGRRIVGIGSGGSVGMMEVGGGIGVGGGAAGATLCGAIPLPGPTAGERAAALAVSLTATQVTSRPG